MRKGGHTSFQPSPKADGASHMEKSLFMISLYCGTCVHCLLQTQAQPGPPSSLCPLGSVSIKSQLCAPGTLLVLAILTPPSVVVPPSTCANSASILWRRGEAGAGDVWRAPAGDVWRAPEDRALLLRGDLPWNLSVKNLLPQSVLFTHEMLLWIVAFGV